MQKNARTTNFIAGAAIALAFSFTLQAGVNRTFVATTGNDANVSVNCSATAYCRTFGVALSVTNAGGEVVVVNSGGYGSATISQPVTITANGIDASITETTSGDSALTINTTGNVTITGLNLFGGGSGTYGILVSQVGFLRLYSMQIQGFAQDGIYFTSTTPGNLAMYNSKINDSGHDGLLLYSSGSRAWVDNSDFDNNAFAGADSALGKLDVADSYAHYNEYGFFADGGTVVLYNCRAIFNHIGVAASGTSGVNGVGHLYFTACLLADNTDAWVAGSGGVLSGSSPGTTLVAPGQATSGTMTAAQTLQ